ncbi:hypothetical protein OF83DRAFT_637853 [Amylostereum chailletii]|nr:hypothetical protein OF83DRAFT_637853 [Amylostereum chailletii]
MWVRVGCCRMWVRNYVHNKIKKTRGLPLSPQTEDNRSLPPQFRMPPCTEYWSQRATASSVSTPVYANNNLLCLLLIGQHMAPRIPLLDSRFIGQTDAHFDGSSIASRPSGRALLLIDWTIIQVSTDPDDWSIDGSAPANEEFTKDVVRCISGGQRVYKIREDVIRDVVGVVGARRLGIPSHHGPVIGVVGSVPGKRSPHRKAVPASSETSPPRRLFKLYSPPQSENDSFYLWECAHHVGLYGTTRSYDERKPD